MESLNSLVSYYQNTGLGLGEIVKRLALRIYHYPLGKYGAGEDDCGEFYLFFYPRLLRSIRHYEDRGKPFEWYFNSVLHWHYKVYCSRKRREETRWTAARNILFWDLPDPEFPSLSPGDPQRLHDAAAAVDCFGGSRRDTWRRRILFLALKNARHLDDPAIQWISDLTGIGEEHLMGMAERLRTTLYKRELRLHELYRRQNKILTKIYLLQRDLLWEVDPAVRSELALSLSGLRSGLRSLQRKIRRVRLNPSNREIAELLDIPKGTVDTSLYWLRHQLLDHLASGQQRETQRLCA
jgi:DNA-directed RNA polymerase specialized sigma24 family protein